MKRSTFKLSLLILIVLTFANRLLGNDLLFGPEFTFTVNERNWDERLFIEKYLDHLKAHLVLGQNPGEEFIYDEDDFSFSSPEGWKFTIQIDKGVIEVIMDPMTVGDFKKYQDNIHDAIFSSAFNTGLSPFEFQGGGHINIGLDYFKKAPLLLRNFIVDFLNHNELSMGILNYDTNNALPIWLQSQEHINEVRRVLRDFNRGDYAAKGIYDFLAVLNGAFKHEMVDEFWMAWSSEGSVRAKHRALYLGHSLAKSAKTRRLEIRSVRPQKTMDMFVRQIDLFKHRIEYLKTIKYPIALKEEVRILPYSSVEEIRLAPPIDPQQALKAFHKYVTESGLNWDDHKDYLWPQWVQGGEVEKFDKSIGCSFLLTGEKIVSGKRAP